MTNNKALPQHLTNNVDSFMDLHTAIYAAATALVRTIGGTTEPLSKHPIRIEKTPRTKESRTKATADLSKDTGRA
jgi:hypothetical protein